MASVPMEFDIINGNTFMFRGEVDSSVNAGSGTTRGNLNAGWYFVMGTVPNSFPDVAWCYLIVLNRGNSQQQIIISNTRIYVRTFVGNPMTWTTWGYVNLTQAS